MNIVDIMIILILIIFIAKGASSGAVKETVSFVGGLAVIIIAYFLKNPVSVFLYQTMPFFKFGGILSGITVLNIIIYELIAFLLVATILLIIYEILLRVTNIFETILKLTVILALPSKILGAIVGFIEGLIVTFIILFVCVQIPSTRVFVNESKYGNVILDHTPILNTAISPIYNSLIEIYKVADEYTDDENRDAANLECLEILLKYKVLSPANADLLVEKGKLTMPGAEEVIDKYRVA